MPNGFQELTPAERERVLGVLRSALREVFPDFRLPADRVHEVWKTGADLEEIDWSDFPKEISLKVADALKNKGKFMASVVFNRRMEDYLYQDSARQEEMRRWLVDHVGPAFEEVCRIDRRSFRLLWRDLLAHMDSRSVSPTDLVLSLAEAFAPGGSRSYVEFIVYDQFLFFDTLTPNRAYALRQLALLAEETSSLSADKIIELSLKTGDFDRAHRLVLRDFTDRGGRQGPLARKRINRFNGVVCNLEGMLLYLNIQLAEYLDALEVQEREYHARRTPTLHYRLGNDGRPLLSTLLMVEAAACSPETAPSSTTLRHDLHTCYYLSIHTDTYQGLKLFLPVMLYAESTFYNSPDGQRLMEEAERWVRYWACNNHRYQKRESNHQADELAGAELLRQVITIWHTFRDDGPALLRRCRELLRETAACEWVLEASSLKRTSNSPFRLLPLWLVEIRALRIYGRGTAEWEEANRIAVERLSFLACRVDLSDFWTGDPALVLMILEAVRQLAVARGEGDETGVWDREIVRCVRQILVRLETIDDPRVRRTLSSFVHPVLTSVAAYQTAVDDCPLESLCLFEMARSRWMLDHLSGGARTLRVHSDDDDEVRVAKDQLFNSLNPVLSREGPSRWEQPRSETIDCLRARYPHLARLVSATWLGSEGVRHDVPAGASILAYHVEQDPADPPVVMLRGPDEPWPQEPPGENARLWMFLYRDGLCDAVPCEFSAAEVRLRVYQLEESNRDCLVKTANGQPQYRWEPGNVREYEERLSWLATALVGPWEDRGIFPRDESPMLISPTGKLFELPWTSLPLKHGGRLIDAVVPGVMPGLGIGLWASAAPSMEHRPGVEIFVQAVPNPPNGLLLPPETLDHLRSAGATVIEGKEATPERAVAAFRDCHTLGFLCHGLAADRPHLQLAPPGEQGRLTIRHFCEMKPVDHVRTVLLGACWTGLEAGGAADDVDGLTSILLLKGVRSLLSGVGWVPIDLLAAVGRVLTDHDIPFSTAALARLVRQIQRDYRGRLESKAGVVGPHPVRWSAITFHGTPWESEPQSGCVSGK